MFKTIKYSLLMIFFIFLSMPVSARIIFQDNFDGYTDALRNHGWEGGTSANFSMPLNQGINNSRCVMVTYNQSGTTPYWLGKNIENENLRDIYVRFYFKLENPYNATFKHLKLFGKQNSPEGYANSTFGIVGGKLYNVGYGKGDGVLNDSQTSVRYSGPHWESDPNLTWRVYSSIITVSDNRWRCMEVHMRYNNNDSRDGQYQVWIDGDLKLDVTNVKNRNNANSLYFSGIELANYCDASYSQPFRIWYDNFVISDQYIGPIEGSSTPSPTPIDTTPPTSPKGINLEIR